MQLCCMALSCKKILVRHFLNLNFNFNLFFFCFLFSIFFSISHPIQSTKKEPQISSFIYNSFLFTVCAYRVLQLFLQPTHPWIDFTSSVCQKLPNFLYFFVPYRLESHNKTFPYTLNIPTFSL